MRKIYAEALFDLLLTSSLAISPSSSSRLPINRPLPYLESITPKGAAPNMLAIPKTPGPVSGVLAGTFAPATVG